MSPSRSERFLASLSDDRLVSLARSGNERAFAAIVERFRPELLAHARRLVTDGRAEDVVQQAFLSAFAALRSGAEVRHPRGWLYRIVRNETIRSHRPPDVSLENVAATGEPLEDVVAERALALTALSELGRLPGRQREALVGTALQGRGRSEIASAMGLSEGAVRQLVHRARTALRAAVTVLTPYPLAR
jgi:RNA polymerase sigma factor (sigma-70 family)